MPVRASRTKVMEPLEWAFPPPGIPQREVIARLPDGGIPTDRPPLLFVHGLGHGAWCWDEHWLPEAARQGWAAHAVSLRGHGGSGGHEALHRWTLRDYVHDVLQAIIELPAPPILVGHSMGALVVQRVLERYPARGSALLTPSGAPAHGMGTALRLGRRRPVQLVRGLLGQPLELEPDDLFSDRLDPVTARAHTDRTTPESRLAQYQTLLPHRPPAPRGPTLVLAAGADALVPLRAVVRVARHHGTRAHVFPGMGHDLMLDVGWQQPLQRLLTWAAQVAQR
jgi:pimeloyl-ACP methyl ester carboxylesterase